MRTSPFFPLSRAAVLAAGLALAISTVITAVPAQAVSPQALPAANTCYDYRSSNSRNHVANVGARTPESLGNEYTDSATGSCHA